MPIRFLSSTTDLSNFSCLLPASKAKFCLRNTNSSVLRLLLLWEYPLGVMWYGTFFSLFAGSSDSNCDKIDETRFFNKAQSPQSKQRRTHHTDQLLGGPASNPILLQLFSSGLHGRSVNVRAISQSFSLQLRTLRVHMERSSLARDRGRNLTSLAEGQTR